MFSQSGAGRSSLNWTFNDTSPKYPLNVTKCQLGVRCAMLFVVRLAVGYFLGAVELLEQDYARQVVGERDGAER